MTRAAALFAFALHALAFAGACAPAVDDDGFTLDVDAAIAARAHDFGCFQGPDDPSFTLRLAHTGDEEEPERTAAIIQEGANNFVVGTWSFVDGLEGRRLTIDIPDADFAVETSELEMRYGVLVGFPAGESQCGVRGFVSDPPAESIEGAFRCPDDFFDTVDYTFAAEGALLVEEVREDEGGVTRQSDFGAYYLDGGAVYLLRPERDEPQKRFQEASYSSGASEMEIAGKSCAVVVE